MKLVARIGVVVAAVMVVLFLLFESAIGYFQPQDGTTAVLRSFDAEGQAHDRVLTLHEEAGQLWVESGHWFRGWYNRVLENPEVELIRDGEAQPFTAVPVHTPEAVELLAGKMKRLARRPWVYPVVRTLCLWAPIKPVRLDVAAATTPAAAAPAVPDAAGEPETAPGAAVRDAAALGAPGAADG